MSTNANLPGLQTTDQTDDQNVNRTFEHPQRLPSLYGSVIRSPVVHHTRSQPAAAKAPSIHTSYGTAAQENGE